MNALSFLAIVSAVFAADGPRLPAGRIDVRLTEWKVELSSEAVSAGTVTFSITNAGTIPHAFEVEGAGLEQETRLIQPGDSATLVLTLKPGRYEAYCPVGQDSHKQLGMLTSLRVGAADATGSTMGAATRPAAAARAVRLTGGGPVIQILPGPFPFADSARSVYGSWDDERAALDAQAQRGPYSDSVARIAGTIRIAAWDRGASGDSVNGEANFVTADGARWKLELNRVQTQDVMHHPRFGGVIFGLYYHGASGVHTPLVPTINSAAALWAVGRLSRNGVPVTDRAMVHIMLLSRTRRPGNFALSCWDCSQNPVEELQLQVTPARGEAPFAAPGGVLFVNWERSGAQQIS